jgi:hypothetical protein
MAIDLIIPYDVALIIAVVLPIASICLLYLISSAFGNKTGRWTRYLSYLITPPSLKAKTDQVDQDVDASWRRDKVRIFFLWLGVILFVISFMLGEFYEVMTDLILPVSQGNTGDVREVLNITIFSAFRFAWYGTLPWVGAVSYHETWDWIYFTAAFTDNPAFLGAIIPFLVLCSMVVGVTYLVPLVSKRVRHAFAPSLFSLITGMTIFAKAASSCLAYAIALFFFNAELDYITLTANGSMIAGLATVMGLMLLIVIPIFALFTFIGRRLWSIYYEDSKSKNQFTVYLALVFWFGIILTIAMV